MKLIDASVRNGTAVIVGMILVVMFGFAALRRIPIQLNPTIDRPIIAVETEYPGAAPFEVESEVTRRQERQLAAVENIRTLRSYSMEGESSVVLEFDWGVDKDVAIIDIVKRLESVQNLPEDIEEPQIFASNSEEGRSIIRLTIQSEMSPNEVRNLLEDRIGPQLERVPGVGIVRWHGGARREIHVNLDLAALESRHVTIPEVLQAISRENQNVRGGKIEEGASRMLVRTLAQYSSLDQIRTTVVKSNSEGIIRVADIAEVLDTFEEVQGYGRTMGKPAVNMSISKKTGTNTLEVCKLVGEEIERINKELAPSGINFWINYNAADYIDAAISGMNKNLIFGAVLVVGVLLVFLRSLTATLAIGAALPVCIIGTFVLLAAFGRSVNVISLAGLGIAAGIVVDDAIVVMENIFRHRKEFGSDPAKASRDGAVEVWGPVLASTLTTLAVFVPVLFVREEAGQLFADIAYAISFAVGLSMIASITIVPMMASRFYKLGGAIGLGMGESNLYVDPNEAKSGVRRKTKDSTKIVGGAISAFFIGTVNAGLRSKMLRLVIVGVMVAGFIASFRLVPPPEYLPQSQSSSIFGRMRSPTGVSLEGTNTQLTKVEEFVLKYPDIFRAFFVIRPEMAFFGIMLKPESANPERAQQVLTEVEQHAAKVLPSDYVFNIYRESDFSWSFEGKTVSLDIRGPDLPMLEKISKELETQLLAVPEVKGVFSSFSAGNPELQIVPDRERLADLGMTSRDLATVVETLVEGTRASLYRDQGKEYDLIVQAREDQIRDPDDLRRVTVSTPLGGDVSLAELARLEKRVGPVQIERLEQERVLSLNIRTDDGTPLGLLIQHINEQVIEPYRATLPPAYIVELSGTADDLDRTLDVLLTSFIFALVIVYLLLSALYESFIYPIIIMFSVPLAMTGAFIGVWVSGSSFDVLTMLGFILLAGVVVKNGILLVDFGLRAAREGVEIHEAMLQAIRIRIRPIFMTSLTTVLGALPMALGHEVGAELYRGLGSAIVGGMILSTIFTIILIPLLLATFLEVRNWIVAKFTRGPVAEVAGQ